MPDWMSIRVPAVTRHIFPAQAPKARRTRAAPVNSQQQYLYGHSYGGMATKVLTGQGDHQ